MTSFTSRDEKGFPRYTSSGEESSLDQPRKGGRPHKAASVEEARAVQPKRRGRPSKTPNIEEETSTSESAVQPTKSGRPPKASSKSKNKPPAKKPRTENYSELEPTESLRLGHRFLFHIGAELKPGDTGLYTLCQIRRYFSPVPSALTSPATSRRVMFCPLIVKVDCRFLGLDGLGSKSLGFNFEEVVNVDPRACVLPADKFAIMVECVFAGSDKYLTSDTASR